MTTQNLNFTDLIMRADDGDMKATNMLHNYYCLEKYMTENYNDELIQLLTERANQNKPYSLLHMAMLYLLGLKLDKDFDRGIELIKKSISVECSEAYYLMAMMVLTNQIEYEMDYNTLMLKAMDMKNSSAFVQAGIEHSDTDFKKSIEFYKKAIKLDNDYAIYKLGELYHDNKKYKLAIKYYIKAMNRNVHHAYFNLAVMHRDGEGMDQDFDKAKELFEKAIAMGNVRAITCLGGIYQEQDNWTEAKKYYKLAINRNDTFAKYNLGLLYREEDKHKKAIKCFIGSARDGHSKSEHLLLYDYCVMDLNMTDEAIDGLLEWHHVFKNFGAYDGFLSR